jgi:hypothetical protein
MLPAKVTKPPGSAMVAQPGGTVMRWLKYLWAVVIGLVTIGVVLTAFGKVHGSFETIVLGAVGVIYATIRAFGYGLAQMQRLNAVALAEQSFQIRRLLNDERVESEESEFKTGMDALSKNDTLGIIRITFVWLIYLVCILNILIA